MEAPHDTYPSRIEGVGQILPREEPVVYENEETKGGPLSPELISSFDSKGYLFFDAFFNADTVAALRAEAEQLRVSEKVRQSELAITEPSTGETRSIFALQTVSELFSKLSRDERVLGIVRQLLGSELYLHQARLNLKPGFRGKEFYWHSDFETWHAEDGMPAMRAINCSIALTDNTELDGPLMVIPGSHKYFCQCSGLTPESHYQQSLKRQDYGVPSDEQVKWLAEQGGIVAPKGSAGSLVITDSNLMHGSNGNITPFPRSNAFFAYNSMENQLCAPYAAEFERPWFLGNRDPEILKPVPFSDGELPSTLLPA